MKSTGNATLFIFSFLTIQYCSYIARHLDYNERPSFVRFSFKGPGLSKVASCWQKSPPTRLVTAGYSAWHFFTEGIFE